MVVAHGFRMAYVVDVAAVAVTIFLVVVVVIVVVFIATPFFVISHLR